MVIGILVLDYLRPGRRMLLDCFLHLSSKAGQPVEHPSVAIPTILEYEFHVKTSRPSHEALTLSSSLEATHHRAAVP
jgi:hypothetical protein